MYDGSDYVTGHIAPVTVGGALIGELVFKDWNGNGQWDEGETGISGVQVQLWSDPNDDGNHADGTLLKTPTTPLVRAVPSLSANVENLNFGFFENLPASIGERVFVDSNMNGVFDAGDVALPHVRLSLCRCAYEATQPDLGGFLGETRTNSAGLYVFEDLGPGTYAVVLDSDDPNIPLGVATSPNFRMAVVVPGQDRRDANFALNRVLNLEVIPAGPASAGDRLRYRLVPNFPRITQVRSAVVRNPLPAGVSLVAGSIPGSGSFGAGTVEWALGATWQSSEAIHVPVVSCTNVMRFQEPENVFDTYINRQSPSTNYHSSNVLVTRPRSPNFRYPLMRFDVSEIPPEAVIQQVTVGSWVTASRSNQIASLHAMLSEWDVTTVRWNDPDGPGPLTWADGEFGTGDYNDSVALGSFGNPVATPSVGID
jgi:hypothetical protein